MHIAQSNLAYCCVLLIALLISYDLYNEPCVRWGPDPKREGALLRGHESRTIIT